MHFCYSCENMMHLRIPVDKGDGNVSNPNSASTSASSHASSAHSNNLFYMCPHCGVTKNIVTDGQNENENDINQLDNQRANANLVYTVNYDEVYDEIDVINEYTKYDPTLPTTDVIPCPNEACTSNSTDEANRTPRKIIYIRYNKSELLYIYLCKHCNTTWKSMPSSV